MSDIRQEATAIIRELLREHDAVDLNSSHERHAIQRKILFLMSQVKASEFAIQ